VVAVRNVIVIRIFLFYGSKECVEGVLVKEPALRRREVKLENRTDILEGAEGMRESYWEMLVVQLPVPQVSQARQPTQFQPGNIRSRSKQLRLFRAQPMPRAHQEMKGEPPSRGD
jgi:hypothetical protein